MNTWELDLSRGWRIGLAFWIVLLLLTIGLAVLTIINPVTVWTFLMGVGAFISLLATVQMGYWLWGLLNAQYTMDRNALVIRWGQIEHQIPMVGVRAVLSGAEISDLRMRPGVRWPGHFVGYGETADLGPILFYATEPLEQQVVVQTDGMAYAISPVDLEAFLLAFRERLEMGPTQEVEESSQRPAVLDWPIWEDHFALYNLGGSALLLLLLLGLLSWRYPYLPSEIALRLGPQGQALLMASSGRIFYLMLLGIIFLLINSTLGLLLYRRERMVAYFLWGGLLALQGGLWVAVISILTHQW